MYCFRILHFMFCNRTNKYELLIKHYLWLTLILFDQSSNMTLTLHLYIYSKYMYACMYNINYICMYKSLSRRSSIFSSNCTLDTFENIYMCFDPCLLQYIGSKETDERANEVQRLGILDLWTPENHYRWSKSRYGDHVSAVVESVNQSRLLLCSMNLKPL